jgi:3-phytase
MDRSMHVLRFALAAALLTGPPAATAAAPPARVRFATFNASLNRTALGQLFTDLVSPGAATTGVAQAKRIAEIIQRNAPDILLVNEFDWDPQRDFHGRTVLDLFHDNFLAVSQNGQPALSFTYRYSATPNTGFSPYDTNEDGSPDSSPPAPSSPNFLDFDNSGTAVTTPGSEAYGNDAFGFGEFRGKYGMAVYSRFPIATASIRRFRRLLWNAMPGARLPDNSSSPAPADWYSPAELAVFRLSSKSHWDVPIDLGGGHLVHFLVAHPTPPVFDGAENRNGLRNADEIRFWAEYIDPARSSWISDDQQTRGGLARGARFVIAGDYNADPAKGDSFPGAAQQLTSHPLILNSPIPSASRYSNNTTNTADFAQDLRVDYVLPSRSGLSILDSAIFWPLSPHPQASLVTTANASDHKLVWLDVRPDVSLDAAVQNFAATWTGNAVRITFSGAPGHLYSLQESTNPAASPWLPVPGADPVPLNPDFSASIDIPPSPPGRRSFRLAISFAP